MTKHITIGVAGHVDHGKTALVQSLTGIDTDRMPEEKEKEMSIVSGIAPLRLSDGRQIALVDVPGHSNYLKNTIRGLACIDMAIIVVAADEGIMPQTREHIEILKCFNITSGMVVITKTDLVDEETVELARLEVEETLSEMHFPENPIVTFSAITRSGLPEIKQAVEKQIGSIKRKPHHTPFRLCIDQARSIAGFGTVVSGTILSGKIRPDDMVEIFPSGKISRVRFVESHSQKIDIACAGQRAGINLSKISLDEIQTGMVLSEPGRLLPSHFLNVSLKLPPQGLKNIYNRQRVKLHIGTGVLNVRVILMEKEHLFPGETALAQFRFQHPVVCRPDDAFIISLMNENIIVGGGRVLEIPTEKYRKSKARGGIPCLAAIHDNDLPAFFRAISAHKKYYLFNAEYLSNVTRFSRTDLESEINRLVNKGEMIYFKGKGAMEKGRYEQLKTDIEDILEKLSREREFQNLFQGKELCHHLVAPVDTEIIRMILDEFRTEKKVVQESGKYRLAGSQVAVPSNLQGLEKIIRKFAEESGLTPFSAGFFCKRHPGQYHKKTVEKMLYYLHTQNELVLLDNGRYLTSLALEKIKNIIRQAILEKGVISVHDSLEILGYGRTQGVQVLDYLDKIGFTVRCGDQRQLNS